MNQDKKVTMTYFKTQSNIYLEGLRKTMLNIYNSNQCSVENRTVYLSNSSEKQDRANYRSNLTIRPTTNYDCMQFIRSLCQPQICNYFIYSFFLPFSTLL
jgi:hypothetical protein